MEIIYLLLLWVLRIGAIVSIVMAFVLTSKDNSKVFKGQQDQSPLAPRERNYVLIMSVLAPLIVQAVFYYGWKKKLPIKAKEANKLGWIGFLIGIVVWIVISFI